MKFIDKVKQDPSILRNFSTPPIEVQKEAIRADPSAIRYIKSPRPEIQKLAVIIGGISAYYYISDPCLEAKKALIEVDPMFVSRICDRDEDLYEHAIRIKPSVIERLRPLPYRLQALALSLVSNPKSFIFKIPGLHQDLIYQHLSLYPNDYKSFNSLPPMIELGIINDARTITELEYIFSNMKNPSSTCQNHYVRVMLAKHKRGDLLDTHYKWWFKLTNKIDDSLKYEILSMIDYNSFESYRKEMFKKIMSNVPEIVTALTLMD